MLWDTLRQGQGWLTAGEWWGYLRLFLLVLSWSYHNWEKMGHHVPVPPVVSLTARKEENGFVISGCWRVHLVWYWQWRKSLPCCHNTGSGRAASPRDRMKEEDIMATVWRKISEISTRCYLGDTGGLKTFMATLCRYSLHFQLVTEWEKNGSNSSSAGIRWYYLNVLPFTWAPFLVLWLHTSWSVLNWTFSYLVLLALPDFQVHHTRCNFTITLFTESCGL